jgi:tetratricopeptide (TPR) repeat protein
MPKRVLGLLVFLAGIPGFAQARDYGLQGRITADRPAASIHVVLQDPKARNAEVASVDADQDGNYSIPGLQKRSYRLVTLVDGKRQDRRDVEILCRPGSIASKDFHYGRSPSTLMLNFPAEDPDFVDVAELQGDYPRDVLRDYEKASEDYVNGNSARAIERLEAIALRAPGFYGVHARLGFIYQQEGCFSDAEAEYVRASELSPRSPQPLLNLASVQLRAADAPGVLETMVARALDTLAKALEIRPGSALAHCLSGAARVKANQLDQAESDFKRALDLDGDLGAARLMLANLYLHQENWDAAIKGLQDYLEDFPYARDRSVVKEMLQDARWKARNNSK